MHIPDGFLDIKTASVTGALAAGGLGFALVNARKNLPARKVPLLGLSGAFVFAAQMINFPVAAGTSGHLIGGTLVAALLGPGAAIIVLSSVLITQCFLFADGGITSLGANIFNMGIIGGFGGWTIYQLVSKLIKGTFGKIVAATFAGWCSTLLASIACAAQLSASGTVPWKAAFPAMAGIHMLIGIGEGIITALVLSSLWKARPDLVDASNDFQTTKPMTSLLFYSGLIALGIAIFVSPFASSSPDGLEKAAEHLGFAETAHSIVQAPMGDYKFGLISKEALSTSIAGAIGTVFVFVLAWVLAKFLVGSEESTMRQK